MNISDAELRSVEKFLRLLFFGLRLVENSATWADCQINIIKQEYLLIYNNLSNIQSQLNH